MSIWSIWTSSWLMTWWAILKTWTNLLPSKRNKVSSSACRFEAYDRFGQLQRKELYMYYFVRAAATSMQPVRDLSVSGRPRAGGADTEFFEDSLGKARQAPPWQRSEQNDKSCSFDKALAVKWLYSCAIYPKFSKIVFADKPVLNGTIYFIIRVGYLFNYN